MQMNIKTWLNLQRVAIATCIGSIVMLFYWFGYRLNGEIMITKETLPTDSIFLYVLLALIAISIVFWPIAELAMRNDGKVNVQTFLSTILFFVIIVTAVLLVRTFIY
jgi:hypothetical protein